MARATSASLTVRTPARLVLSMGKVSSPGIGDSSASHRERGAGGARIRSPASSERRGFSPPPPFAPQLAAPRAGGFVTFPAPPPPPPAPPGPQTTTKPRPPPL